MEQSQVDASPTALKPAQPAVMGRPTLYKPEYCETILELGRKGYSQAMMAAHWEVAKATINDWAKANPDFSNALARARVLSQGWWEKKAQEGLENREFNAALWKHSVTSRFREDYTDVTKTEVTGKDGGALEVKSSDSALAREVAFMLMSGAKAIDHKD